MRVEASLERHSHKPRSSRSHQELREAGEESPLEPPKGWPPLRALISDISL